MPKARAEKELFFLLDEPLESDDRQSRRGRKIAKNLFDKMSRVPRLPEPDRVDTEKKARRSIQELLTANGITVGDAHREAMRRGAVTCAVFGAWGSGKTSFLKLLRKQYRESGSTTVWFEPWRYEREDHLLVPLMVEISGTIAHRITQDNVKQAALETGKRLIGRAARAVLRTGGKVVERHLGVDPYQIGESFLEQYGETSTDWTESLSETEKFRQGLYDMIELAAGAAAQEAENGGRLQYPVAVFIDDLDRCDPAQVRRLLESIKLFLDAPGCIFFIALDEEQVQFALSKPYQEIFPQPDGRNVLAQMHGRRYLDKFFQQSVRLDSHYSPHTDSILWLRWRLWRSLRRHLSPEAQKRKSDLQKIFGCIKLNPRALKRAARWLYTEQDLLPADELVREFAEFVFSMNYETVWVAEIQDKSMEGRISFFFSAALCIFGLDGELDNENITALTQFYRRASDMTSSERLSHAGSKNNLFECFPSFLHMLSEMDMRHERNEIEKISKLIYYAGGYKPLVELL